jgi:hypothetical protein
MTIDLKVCLSSVIYFLTSVFHHFSRPTPVPRRWSELSWELAVLGEKVTMSGPDSFNFCESIFLTNLSIVSYDIPSQRGVGMVKRRLATAKNLPITLSGKRAGDPH